MDIKYKQFLDDILTNFQPNRINQAFLSLFYIKEKNKFANLLFQCENQEIGFSVNCTNPEQAFMFLKTLEESKLYLQKKQEGHRILISPIITTEDYRNTLKEVIDKFVVIQLNALKSIRHHELKSGTNKNRATKDYQEKESYLFHWQSSMKKKSVSNMEIQNKVKFK